jgi:microcin C transport system substrate-binding protein
MMTWLRPGLNLLSIGPILLLLAVGAQAQEKRHASSLIGTPKYGPGFQHFDYVNPNAPKGGSARLSAIGTFDSLNIIP